MTAAIDSLQRALAAEHAAVWGYGLVGATLPPAQQPLAASADQAHRAHRDALEESLRARRATPVAAAASYQLPFPVTDPQAARALAAHLEQGSAANWYAVLPAVSAPADRRLAVSALTDAATRGLQWRLMLPGQPSTVPFPGA
ncbi:MAG: ferritin-like domain-containing protein [Actinomycetota bacterium]|nr:ferritin-like domain-containing protein [Actinomycetota bacterium]